MGVPRANGERTGSVRAEEILGVFGECTRSARKPGRVQGDSLVGADKNFGPGRDSGRLAFVVRRQEKI